MERSLPDPYVVGFIYASARLDRLLDADRVAAWHRQYGHGYGGRRGDAKRLESQKGGHKAFSVRDGAARSMNGIHSTELLITMRRADILEYHFYTAGQLKPADPGRRVEP